MFLEFYPMHFTEHRKMRNARHPNTFFSEFGSDLMCHDPMRFIILGSVPQSYRIVAHQVETKLWIKSFGMASISLEKCHPFLSTATNLYASTPPSQHSIKNLRVAKLNCTSAWIIVTEKLKTSHAQNLKMVIEDFVLLGLSVDHIQSDQRWEFFLSKDTCSCNHTSGGKRESAVEQRPVQGFGDIQPFLVDYT
jgi:hypothetical protein